MRAGSPASGLSSLHGLVWTSLLAASIAAGAFLSLPIGPVPVSMQPFFVFLAGYALGPARGAWCVVLYILAGLIGFPVFTGGKAGLGHLLGPTGGYLVGFIGMAWLCGLAVRHDRAWLPSIFWGIAGLIVEYACGAAWLKTTMALPWSSAFMAGVAPFLPWDLLKLGAAAACCRHLGRHGLLPA